MNSHKLCTCTTHCERSGSSLSSDGGVFFFCPIVPDCFGGKTAPTCAISVGIDLGSNIKHDWLIVSDKIVIDKE